MSRNLNWADLISNDLAFVVLSKGNRVQVLVRPNEKQLRRRGKRGWSLLTAIHMSDSSNGQMPLPDELREAIMQALTDLTTREPGKKAGKLRPAKAKKLKG